MLLQPVSSPEAELKSVEVAAEVEVQGRRRLDPCAKINFILTSAIRSDVKLAWIPWLLTPKRYEILEGWHFYVDSQI